MKKHRQRFFVAKELRLSIALIILWSLLAVVIITFAIKKLTDSFGLDAEAGGFGPVAFLLVMGAYAAFVMFFSTFFSHRFLGPFVRLKLEIRRILGGQYDWRLHVRTHDDPYISSFIEEVNRILVRLEELERVRGSVRQKLDSVLMEVIAELENPDMSRERQRQLLLSMHRDLKALLNRVPEPEEGTPSPGP